MLGSFWMVLSQEDSRLIQERCLLERMLPLSGHVRSANLFIDFATIPITRERNVALTVLYLTYNFLQAKDIN